MKRHFFSLITAAWLIPMSMTAQTFESLWKQVDEAQQKDLPKTAIAHLQKIEQKAEKEQAYGQLLKSAILYSKLQAEVAPDSLRPAVMRLEQREQATKDIAQKAVYDAVLSRIYSENHELANDWEARCDNYRREAMKHPDVLARTKADGFVPFVIKGKDSNLFSHDLLSIIGMELNEWQWLTDYYAQSGNRPAACLTALQTIDTVEGIDSLLNIYGDLPEAGELAIRRYELMDSNYTAAQKNAWIDNALTRWGSWKRVNTLRNAKTMLNNPNYQVHIDQRVMEVGKAQMLKLTNLRHLQSVTMRLYRTQLAGDTSLNPEVKEDYDKMKGGLTELKDMTRTLTFSRHADYELFEDSVEIKGLPAGVYMVEFSSQPDTHISRALYFVSGIRVLAQGQPNNKMRYVVVDATTGQPIANATLRLSFNKGYNKPAETKLLTCDKQGEAIYEYGQQRPSSIFAYTASDNCSPAVSSYGTYNYYEQQANVEHINLFTDRSIYRPGQTVHVTAIAWKEQTSLDNTAVSGKAIKLELRDANYRVISEQQVTTDRFGKAATLFTLPKGLLNGRFTIVADGSSVGIQVEEYKRPTFQVEFSDYKAAYQHGDTIPIQGKAVTYTGIPIQDGKVKYSVKRRVAFWWMSYSNYWQNGYVGRGLQDEILCEGETRTNGDGTFCIDAPIILPDDLGRGTMFFNIVVEADVTDTAGETRNNILSLPLSNKAIVLTCDLPQQVRSDQMPKVTFTRRNAAGKEIVGTVKYRIDGKKWQQGPANAQLSIINTQLKSGEHRLEAICESDSIDMTFVVFGLDDKKPATLTKDWFYVSDTQFSQDGKPVTLQVGSSDPDLYIVYSIFAGNKEIESGAIKKDASLENRKFTYKEEYGNGLLLTYAWVKNGQSYRHQTFIRRPMPDKQLKLTWETFRDRLTPGQQEEWRLSVKKPDGTPADASLLAVLYDKSLDAIMAHQWSFTPVATLSQPSTSWQWRTWGSVGLSGSKSYQLLNVPTITYSSFDSNVFPFFYRIMPLNAQRRLLAKAMPMMAKAESMDDVAKVAQADLADILETGVTEESIIAGNGDKTQESKQEAVQLRQNLNETAFCYPALETNGEGVAILKFTLPESLTTWRFMGIANTTDMLYGNIEGEAIAQKDIMVQPNIPRFIRMGDEASIATRIFNNADHSVSGVAKLQLIDPETEIVVLEQEQPFSVESGKTGGVNYHISLPASTPSLLVCRIIANGDGFSDGEQHYLPILSNREFITKTIPYTQQQAGVKAIDLQKLFPQGTTQQKLTVEYTNNPVWFMVQSLPTIGQPYELSAIDQAAAYYSNLLAKNIIAQNPQVQNVFGQWKQESMTDAATLTSQLAQNEELKDLVLAETPWVSAADKESEQKQRLADFFDENEINYRLSSTIEKLSKLQNPDGSFSWYPGMEGSTYITVAVEEMLARLTAMTGKQGDILPLQDKAFDYIGRQMVELVAKMKKEEKKGHRQTFPSMTALRWLYICAIDGRSLANDVKAANNYLVSLLKKDIKKQTIYEKAMTAVVLAQRGEQKQAAEYVKSLKEYTVYTEEMGRYYDTRRSSYSWYDYKIPTEVAAIEAIQRITPQDTQTIDEMRRWLLQEKRTQTWDTPINSVNAIYAFLNGNSQQLTNNNSNTVLAIDGTPIETPKATAGLGYVKTAISEPKGKTFTATKTSAGTSWGAVYAQFFQKAKEVENSQSGITIKREILPLNAKSAATSAFAVGDRIRIRITIDSERDLDFVQITDRRAACLEPVNQLTGYQNGAYVSPKDYATHYFFGMLSKGRHVIETEYYIDRSGQYETGTCTVGCAYAPEFRATSPSLTINIKE